MGDKREAEFMLQTELVDGEGASDAAKHRTGCCSARLALSVLFPCMSVAGLVLLSLSFFYTGVAPPGVEEEAGARQVSTTEAARRANVFSTTQAYVATTKYHQYHGQLLLDWDSVPVRTDSGTEVHWRSWYGRLGNNVQQLANGLMLCEILANQEGRSVALRFNTSGNPGKYIGQVFALPQTILVSPTTELSEVARAIQCPIMYNFFGACDNVNNHDARRVLMKYAKPLLQPAAQKACDSEHFPGLTIHLRSGDLRDSKKGKAAFVPCSFFDKIIEEHRFSSVRLVTEADLWHPCIRVLPERHPNVHFVAQSKTVWEDFCALMGASHLATSMHSTFPIMASLMSGHLQNLWAGAPVGSCRCPPAGRSELVTLYCHEIQYLVMGRDANAKVQYITTAPRSWVSNSINCSWELNAAYDTH